MADDYFESYAEMLSEFGGEIDQSTGLIRIPSDAVNQVPDLNFKTDAAVMPLIGDAQ